MNPEERILLTSICDRLTVIEESQLEIRDYVAEKYVKSIEITNSLGNDLNNLKKKSKFLKISKKQGLNLGANSRKHGFIGFLNLWLGLL